MAKWYNAYLTKDEQARKQISSKGITARRRKEQASAISKDIANNGIASNTKQRIMQELKPVKTDANYQKAKATHSWQRQELKPVKTDANYQKAKATPSWQREDELKRKKNQSAGIRSK